MARAGRGALKPYESALNTEFKLLESSPSSPASDGAYEFCRKTTESAPPQDALGSTGSHRLLRRKTTEPAVTVGQGGFLFNWGKAKEAAISAKWD